MKISFSKINKLIFFGGARLLAEFAADVAKQGKFSLVVFSAQRHLDESVTENEQTLRKFLTVKQIRFYESEDINRDERLAREMTPTTLGIGIGAAWMFDEHTVKLFAPNHLVDFMGIDLPRYRGGAHYTWQILHRNRTGCANLQVIRGGVETFHRGEILQRSAYRLPSSLQTPADFFRYIVKREVDFLRRFLKDVTVGKQFALTALDELRSSYYPFLSTHDQGCINWGWSGKDIALFIDSFDDPYPGAWTFVNGKKVTLKGVKLLKAGELYHPFTSGLVVRKEKDVVFVATVGGLLRIEHASLPLVLGDRLYTPSHILDAAMGFHASYGAKGLQDHKNNKS